jgi:serine/threonine-protein kinase
LIGVTLAGKYELVKRIGEGGMGVVYEAVNALTGRHVAVKLLATGPGDDTARQRLLREARAAAALRHPNVVDVLDVALDGQYGTFLVMDLLQGESLHDHLERRGKLAFHDVATLLGPIAEALAVAHDKGVVHRDLKPSNIFLHEDARGTITPKLVDFGIAIADGPRFTNTGAMTGTVGYMAPEQMSDAKRATERSDIWAFAVVVYECLSGSLPFAGTTSVELIANVLASRLIPLDQAAPGTPPHVVLAVHEALNADPQRRPQRVADFSNALGFTRANARTARASATEAAPFTALTTFSTVEPSAPAETQRDLHTPASTPNASKLTPKRWPLLVASGAITSALSAFVLLKPSSGAPSLDEAAHQPRTALSVTFEHAAPLPKLDLRPLEAGIASIGSSLEEARAARESCVSESGEERCPLGTFERESPVSNVPIRAFRLAHHETTNAELLAWLMNQRGLALEPDRVWLSTAGEKLAALHSDVTPQAGLALDGQRVVLRAGFGDHPALYVSHRAAQLFCAALGARLPTAAEWEWAARGADRRRYSWGNALFGCHRTVAARADGLACGGHVRGPVSVFEALQDQTPEGITGLAGNAAEWVNDASPASIADPLAPCGGDGCFLIKGGDTSSPSWVTRATAARAAPASFSAGWLGWRCAADGPSPQ